MSFPLNHPFLRLNFGSLVPCSPFSSYSNSPKKYSSDPRQSSTSKDHLPSPLEPLASLLVGLPSLLSFVPLSFPSFFPQQPQGYTVMISLSWLSTFETTHVDNRDNRIIPLTNSPRLNHAPLEFLPQFIYGKIVTRLLDSPRKTCDCTNCKTRHKDKGR